MTTNGDSVVYGLFRHRPPKPWDANADRVTVVFDMLRQLTRDEYDEAGEAARVLHEVLRGFDRNIGQSHTDLNASKGRIAASLTSADALQDVSVWGSELIYRVTNFSVALAMHQVYVLSEVNHIYGSGSEIHTNVKTLFGEAYDSHFAYRLVYGLRNAVVHSSRQLVALHAAARIVNQPGGGERIVRELRCNLIREAFAATKSNAKLREEVRQLEEPPELLVACEAAWAVAKSLQLKLNPLLHPGRDNAVQIIWNYLVETSAAGGYGPYFHAMRGNDLQNADIVPITRSLVEYVWKAGNQEGLRPPLVMP